MRTRHSRIAAALTACIALAGCIILASCNDDARDPAAGADPTTQPLIFSATVATPTTAVATPTSRANTAASQWTDGDEVAVEMNNVVKKYIIKAAAGATATLNPADENNTHYWPGATASVRAWRYGHNFDPYVWDKKPYDWSVQTQQGASYTGVVSLYQQSDFLYAPAKSLSYDASSGMGAGLTFYHQTARVEVRVRKAGLVNDGNKESMEVWIGYRGPDVPRSMLTYGTFDAGQINPNAGQYSGLTAAEGNTGKQYIVPNPMPATSTPTEYARCYEALVIPQNMDGEKFICIELPDKEACYYTPKPGEADLRGGYTYTYDITVSEHGRLDVTVGKPIAHWEQQEGGSGTAVLETTPIDLDNPQTISDDGAYLMTGTNHNGNILNITGGSPLVILRDLNFSGSIHITGGTPEIRVEGTNNAIISMYISPIWLEGDDANVRITGRGIHESRLELYMQTRRGYAAIGSERAALRGATACGNIEISNLTLEASTVGSDGAGAVIGTGGGQGSEKCGNITITDACIIASPGSNAAAIGFGSIASNAIHTDMTRSAYEIGDITITNSTIESIITPNGSFQGQNAESPAHIGGGQVAAATYKVGAIRINTDKSATEFFAKFVRFDGGIGNRDEVIVGFPAGAEPKDGTRFDIYWNGTLVGTEIRRDDVPGLQ